MIDDKGGEDGRAGASGAGNPGKLDDWGWMQVANIKV